MRWYQRLSFKLVVGVFFLVGFFCVTVSYVVTSLNHRREQVEIAEQRDAKFELIKRQLEDAGLNTSPGEIMTAEKLKNLPGLAQNIETTKILEQGFVALVDDSGKTIVSTKNADSGAVALAFRAADGLTTEGWNVKKTALAPLGVNLIAAYSDFDPQIVNRTTQVWTRVLIGVLVFQLLSVIFVYFLTRRLTRRLNEVVEVADKISAGDLTQDLRVTSSGEIGLLQSSIKKILDYSRETANVADKIAGGDTSAVITPRSDDDLLGKALENMLEKTLKFVQTQDERDNLQRSIMKLLNEVADVADGDLTAEAEVTADATGAIADAFNYMILELRNVIGGVKSTTVRVDGSAKEIRLTSETMSRRSEQQSTQLVKLSQSLESMAGEMQIVAGDVNLSVRVADNALANAKFGSNTVQSNIVAMTRIRSHVQETSERIKRLGERSQEISSIVKIIHDLAQRTSVLALNASIQAAAAGQQGRGFVAVAEEVERLAERSSSASKQIDVLTKAIQGETNEAVTSMETTVKEVAVGVKLTGEVGQTLEEIETVSMQLSELSHNIAAAARRTAGDSTEISANMRIVAEGSQQNAADMRESAASISQLAVWSQELRASVASFRLPVTDETLIEPGINHVNANTVNTAAVN